MDRRSVIKAGLAAPLLGGLAAPPGTLAALAEPPAPAPSAFASVRPCDAGWPDPAAWAGLGRAVGGRPTRLASPFAGGAASVDDAACRAAAKNARNPFWLRRPGGVDAGQRLGRCLDIAGQRLARSRRRTRRTSSRR